MDLYLMRDIELQLRQAAEEIRRKNHNGWGNVCEQAADALANALDELAAERARADAAVAEAAEHKLFREESARRLRECTAHRDRLRAAIERALAELAALRTELAVLRNNQLGPVPEGPLKALGAWIADHTDDDTWPDAERYLNAALAEMETMRAHDRDGERLRKGLNAVRELINESTGVYGLHLNGDVSPWDELRTGGRFEEWLMDFDAAIGASMRGEG